MGRNAQIKSTRREIRRAIGARVVEDFNTLANRIDAVARHTEQQLAARDTAVVRSITDSEKRLLQRIEALEAAQNWLENLGFFGRLKAVVFGR